MTVIKLSFTVLSELYWIRWQFRIHSYKSATKRQSLTAYTIFIRSDIKPVFWLCAVNVCSKDFHKPNTLCKYGSTNKTALPCSTSPCSSVIQPSNGLWDGRAENKTHANAWPGSRVSPPAIEHHSSQVQPTWSLIYQWEALPTFRHWTILPSSRQKALSSPPVPPLHTHFGPCPGKTSPHLLWTEEPFRRLLRKSRGVGKRRTGAEQRTEETGERGENVL